MEAIGNAVVDEVLKREKCKLKTDTEAISLLYSKRTPIHQWLTSYPFSLTYPEIIRLHEDVCKVINN